VISTDPPEISNAFRTGLGATYTFLSDYQRQAITQLDMAEVASPDFKYGHLALPYTFSLHPDLTIHNIYNGWWFVGRPTVGELRQDLRAIIQACRSDYRYDGPSLAAYSSR
jgi:peroxiredoxin